MPTPTYTGLATVTLAANATSVTFGSIPSSVNGTQLRDLVLVINGTTTTTPGYFFLYFNGNSDQLYSRVEVNGVGGSAGSFAAANSIVVTLLSGTQSTHISQIADYTSTLKHKTWLYRNSLTDNSGSLAAVGRWASNAAITSLSLSSFSGGTFVTGTTISLFGIAG